MLFVHFFDQLVELSKILLIVIKSIPVDFVSISVLHLSVVFINIF